MTAFYKIVDNGYISGIGTNGSDSVTAITESEYADILSAIRNRPTAPDGFEYKLKADLTWERVPIEPEPEPTIEDKAEAYDILIGGTE